MQVVFFFETWLILFLWSCRCDGVMEREPGPELTIYSARYASPPQRSRPSHPALAHHAQTHHFHDFVVPPPSASGPISFPPRGPPLPLGGGQPFSGPLSLPQGSGYWRPTPRRHHHHHHHTFPPYPLLPPPPPQRLHFHPHGHTSLPHLGLREPPPPLPAGRWDEDPCFLRPSSPGAPCPHDPRAAPPQQEDGTCFVVMGSRDPPHVPRPFAAINPHVLRHQQQEQHRKEQQHRQTQQAWQHRRQQDEDAIYSYAGEGIFSPADVIRAQAAMDDFNSYSGSLASENIYEEIPENWRGSWARRSLVEEVMDEYERVRAGHRRVLSALNLDVETLIRPGGQDGTASPDSGLTISASDSSCEPNHTGYDHSRPRSPTHHGDSGIGLSTKGNNSPKSSKNSANGSPKNKGRLVKCESMDIKEAFSRRPSGGRGRGLREKIGSVREKMEKRWRFPNFSKKGKCWLSSSFVYLPRFKHCYCGQHERCGASPPPPLPVVVSRAFQVTLRRLVITACRGT